MTGINRRRSSLLAGVTLAFIFLAVPFALTYKARLDAAKYLAIIMPLRIGTPYNAVGARLTTAGLATKITGDCRSDCTLGFVTGDKWLYILHLAPPVGFAGRLDFKNGSLVYKKTSMGQDLMVWSASVIEGSPGFGSLTPGLHGTQDSSGNIRHYFIGISASDSVGYREKAYAFNLACIGAIRACRADEYLPIGDLRRSGSQKMPRD